MTYAEFGDQHDYEHKLDAAIAGIAVLYGTEWENKEVASYLGPAMDRLFEFAGDDAYLEAADIVSVMDFDDEPVPDLVELGIQSLGRAFKWKESPNGHRWWRDVARIARTASKVAHA